MNAMVRVPDGGDLFGGLLFAAVVVVAVWLIRWIVVHFQPDGHWVYEIDMEDGQLLYVGRCGNIAKRMRWHVQKQRLLPDGHPGKWWWDSAPEVQANLWPTRQTWYRSKELAAAAEKERIRRKNPIANQIRYRGVMTGGE